MGLRRCESLHHRRRSAGRGAPDKEHGSLQHGAKTAPGQNCFVRGDALQLTVTTGAAIASPSRRRQTCHALVQDGSCSGTLDAVVYCTGAASCPPLLPAMRLTHWQYLRLHACKFCCVCRMNSLVRGFLSHAAAGYQYAYPFLDDVVSTRGNRVVPLYKHVWPLTAPGLAFIGLVWKSLRFIQFEMQVFPPSSLSSPAPFLRCKA